MPNASTPFEPLRAATVNIAVSASSQRVALAGVTNISQIRVFNGGTATVFIDFGDSTVTASTTADIPVPAGAVEVLTFGSTAVPEYAAAIAAGSTGPVYFTPGAGI